MGGVRSGLSIRNGKAFYPNLMKQGDFKGELYQCQLLYTQGALPAKRVLLTGLGKKRGIRPREVAGRFCKGREIHPGFGDESDSFFRLRNSAFFRRIELAEAFVTGLLLGVYQFNELKTLDRDKIKEIEEGVLLGETPEETKRIENGTQDRQDHLRIGLHGKGSRERTEQSGDSRPSWPKRQKRSRKNTEWSFRFWR